MWHEKAAAGNIFRQPQIILHVCARTLTSGQEVEATTKTGQGKLGRRGGREGLEWEPVGVELGYYNICLFVDIKTQFMQRHYYQTLLTFESRLQATPPPPPLSFLLPGCVCNMQQCGFLRCGFGGLPPAKRLQIADCSLDASIFAWL